MKRLQNPFAERTTFTYDDAGRLTEQQLGNSTRATHTYDAANRLTFVQNVKSDNSVLDGLVYDYDHAGNRKSLLEASGIRTTWTYDATNQLTNELRGGPGTLGWVPL